MPNRDVILKTGYMAKVKSIYELSKFGDEQNIDKDGIMKGYCDKELVISEVGHNYVRFNRNTWCWNDWFIEPILEEHKKQCINPKIIDYDCTFCHEVLCDKRKESILPNLF